MEGVIEADPLATAVRTLMTERTEWEGTASKLLDVLGEFAGNRAVKSKTWPNSSRALGMRLRRAATFLRKIGIEVDHKREGDRARTRLIRITSASSDSAPEKAGTQTSETSASSASMRKAYAVNVGGKVGHSVGVKTSQLRMI